MRGDFDEDEYDDDDSGYCEPDDEVCADCGRVMSGEDQCGVCGVSMCFACFEMGAGVCKGPHR